MLQLLLLLLGGSLLLQQACAVHHIGDFISTSRRGQFLKVWDAPCLTSKQITVCSSNHADPVGDDCLLCSTAHNGMTS
jgi:hypothetical protein